MIERQECECGEADETYLGGEGPYCAVCGHEIGTVRYFSLPEIKALLTEDGAVSAYLDAATVHPTEGFSTYQRVRRGLEAAVDALADAIPSEEKGA